jgi:hypothetical protein
MRPHAKKRHGQRTRGASTSRAARARAAAARPPGGGASRPARTDVEGRASSAGETPRRLPIGVGVTLAAATSGLLWGGLFALFRLL